MIRIGQPMTVTSPRFGSLITSRPEKTSLVIRQIFDELEAAKTGHPVVEAIDQKHMDVAISAPDPWRPLGSQNLTVEVRTKGGIIVSTSDDNFAPKTSAVALLQKALELAGITLPEPAKESPPPVDPQTIVTTVSPLLSDAVRSSLGFCPPPKPRNLSS
jgi:hypothetical protein